ncbi:nitrous oxide reductase family maturation protein NosD [Niastella caeni]|uniref:Nitrous oxide reductase family maturation protein NosD n=1 Tax=Niastella caeni TaxID=2569763 RepID=A0A4S8HDS6_9BACT|nr:nitrous oxide reductase family maturation protein NosD [Niastella caeni]THU30732.1 nitrous oxide reductase family maturation protein NosD [Niastella caeni]
MRNILIVLLLLVICNVSANTVVVGKNSSIKTLRQGIAVAKDGDTVLLTKGTYKEGNIIINKSIHLIGVYAPVLDGDHKNEILTLTGKNIVIKGIHFTNAGYSSLNDFAAIKVIDATRIIIENNTINNASFAIHISNATYTTVRNNIISGTHKSEHLSGNGIHLWKCENAMIEGNSVRGHRDGIYFEFVTTSTIQNNTSELNIRYGLHFMFSHNDIYLYNTFRNNGAGVAVMYSKSVRMENNVFDKNWGASAYGILLKDISNSHIRNNKFIKNTVAIHMEGSSRIEVSSNFFQGNGWALKVQASCDDNTFHHNNFNGNSFDVATNGTMTLNRFYNNYWDKYDGYDMNKDGMGDVPYHPVSMYAMVVEQNPTTLMLMRSFMVSLLDKAEKAIPGLTPENLVDNKPMLKPNKL